MYRNLLRVTTSIFLLTLFAFSQNYAQYTGSYTIPGTPFATIKQAVDSLNQYGIGGGGVTFNVTAGYTETTTDSLVLTATGTSGNPIVFQKNGVGANPLITRTDAGSKSTSTLGGQGDAVITIQGSDYVTFNSIDVATVNQGIEYGYYLRKVSATDGCKYVTIMNCVIDLTKGTSGYVAGIYSSNNIPTSLVSSATGVTVTSTGGRNEFVTIIGNTVQDVFAGIVVRGYGASTPYDFYDQNYVIGAIGAGNTIQNYGGNAVAASYGVYMIYHNNISIAYNSINNTGGGGSTFTSTGYGIFTSTGTSSNVDINYNNITVSSNVNSNLSAINNAAGSTAASNTININNNNIQNNIHGTATTAIYNAILNSGSAAVVNINNNIINNISLANTSTCPIIETGSPVTVNVNGNSITNVTRSGASGTTYAIKTTSPTNLTANGNTADVFDWTNIASTGTTYGFYSLSSAVNVTVSNNIFRNFSTPTTGSLYGIREYGSSGTKIFQNNQVYNFSTYTGGAGGAYMYGIYCSTGNIDISGNLIYSLNSTGTTGGTTGGVWGIYVSGGTTNNIYKNKLYDLSSTSTAPTLFGIAIYGGTTNTIYNNLVGDLRTPAANLALPLVGIYLSAGTTDNLYYNTVYLNATSTGALFGSTAVYASTTPTVNFIDNIFVNNSVPTGATGFTTGYRRSSITLTTYGAASNNNDFYAGTPSATNLIMYDGTNSYQTMAAYKAIVTPRDGASLSENPNFVSTVGSSANFLHINTGIATQLESGGQPVSGITVDYDGDLRNGTTPDVGADEFVGILLDLIPPSISYTPLLNTSSTSNTTLSSVVITDPSGINGASGTSPRIYYKKSTDANAFVGNTSTDNGWKWTEATGSSPFSFTIDNSIIFGGSVTTGDVVQYFVVAQDLASPNPPNVGANPSAGFAGTDVSTITSAPTTPNSYTISSVPLAGDYTVGTATFNRVTGRNITFQKVVQKVMKEVDVVVPESPKQSEKGKELKTPDKTSDQPRTVKQLMQVEEVTWVPMENGKPYTGDLYVKKSENPQYNYPMNINGVYTTITAAVADLNLRGISAAVNFLLTDVSYTTGETYPIVVNVANVSKPTALNTVTIKPNTGVTSLIQGTSASSQIIKILTSYVNIDGSNAGSTDRSLTVQNLSATSPQVIVIGSTGTTPITGCSVKNCIVINGANTSSAMVVSDGTAPGTAGYFTNITIQNNSIQLAYIGLYCNAVPSAGNGNGLNITGNSINTSGANAVASVGLYVQGVDGASVTNNDIENFVTTTSYYRYGIWLATGTSNTTVSGNTVANLNTSTSYYPFGITATPGLANSNITIAGNTIDNFTCTSSGDAATGIYAGGASGGIYIQKNLIYHIYNSYSGGYGAWGIALSSTLTASNIEVSNNMIYDVWSYGYASILYENGIGIFVNSGGGYNIYYNSVRLYTNPTAGLSMCMYITSGVPASALNVRNNIFQNDNTLLSNYCVYSGAANTVFADINNNDYYAASATNGYVGYLGANQQTLAAWQTATGKDLNSISGDPKFISNTDLHIQTGFNVVDAKAQYIASVLSDFDNDVRNVSTPDIGADEYIYIPPSVIDPTGVSATPISSTQIDVAFTPNGNSNNVVIVWNSTGTFTAPSGTPPAIGQPFAGGTLLFNGTASPYNHTGLSASTSYFYKLFSYDGSIYSPGVPTSATTLCQIITTFPFAESFDGTTFPPTCWANAQVSGTGLWTGVTAGTFPTCTPHSGAGMTEYASFDYTTGAAAILVTPQITFPNDNYQVSFWMYRDNGYPGNADKVDVYYNTSASAGGTLLGTINRSRSLTPPEAADGWYQYTFYVPTASSGNAYIIFEGTSGYGDNMFVDDVNVDLKPACAPPTGLAATGITNTTANIGWSGSALVDIDYGTPGHPAGTGTVVNAVSTNPYQITGLTAYTSYDVFVRTNCGGTFSAWVGPLNFTTQINPLSLPYAQTFDASTIPAGWTQQGTEWTVSNSSSAGGSPYEMHSLYSSLFGVTRLIVGPINTSGVPSLLLAFKHFYDDYAAGLTIKIQSSSDLNTWTDEAYSFASGGGNRGPETVNTTIANNLGTVTYIAWVVDGDHYEYDNWYVDDVSVTLPLPNDAGTLSIDVPIAVAPGTIAPQATVKNYGTAANTFDVQMTISGGYTSTKTVTSLAPGATQVVTFDNWNAVLGAYTVDVCTQLGTDQNTSNDCLNKLIGVATGSWAGGSSYPNGTYLGSGASYISGGTGYLFSIGGNTNSGLGTECYKYNVSTNSWTAIASLPAGRVVLASTIVGDFLYAIGGADLSTGVYQATVYKYDIVGNAWTTAAPLPAALAWEKAVGYNGKIYVAGGIDATGTVVLSTVYVYDVATDTWTTATSLPAPRFGGAFTVTGNKLVYVGGADLSFILNTVLVGTIDAGNPLLITWTTMANPYPGLKKAVHSEYTGKLNELLKPNMKDITKGHLSINAANYPPGTMYRFDAAPWGTDGIIVANGSPSASWVPADPNPCFVYKPDTDTWLPQFDVPYPVLGASLGSVNSGNTWKLIVASGLDLSGIASDTTQVYTDNLGSTNTFQLSVAVSDGWNMTSVPGINPDGQGVNNWWINHTGTVYKFVPGSGYGGITTTIPGEGYWMKNNGVQTYNTGDEWPAGGIQTVAHDPISESMGWNMFGGYEGIVDPATLTTTPASQIVYPLYKFVPGSGYQTATQIVPGYGYWVKVLSACQINVPSVLVKSNQVMAEIFKDDWGKITITDAAGSSYTLYAVKGQVDLNQYELPPLPPAGLFDVRYSSGRVAEDINSEFKTISMSGVTYPVKVKVENMDIRLQDATGKIVNTNVKAGEEVTISNGNIDKLMVTGNLIPDKYALEQNYPNPFNPSTTIEFSLPENVKNVRISIYNLLGEKVAELVNGAMLAGKYQYKWNAKDLASGMYIYELRTEKFVSIKKMMLLK